MIDWKKEFKLIRRVGETSIFRTLLGLFFVILFVDVFNFSGLFTGIILIPVSFIVNYVYGRFRGVYTYE